MPCLDDAAVSDVHVHTAGHTRIEAPDRAHDIDSFEAVFAVLFKNGRVLDGVLVRAGNAIDVAWTCIPRCWRIRMVIGDLSTANDDVMRQHPANRLMKAAPDCLVRHLELRPGFPPAGVDFS